MQTNPHKLKSKSCSPQSLKSLRMLPELGLQDLALQYFHIRIIPTFDDRNNSEKLIRYLINHF